MTHPFDPDRPYPWQADPHYDPGDPLVNAAQKASRQLIAKEQEIQASKERHPANITPETIARDILATGVNAAQRILAQAYLDQERELVALRKVVRYANDVLSGGTYAHPAIRSDAEAQAALRKALTELD